MENKQALVTASYLTTEEDYTHFKLAVYKGKQGRKGLPVLRILGFLLVLGGGLGMLLSKGEFLRRMDWLLLEFLGLFLSFCEDAKPHFLRIQSENEYQNIKNRLVAQTILFWEDRLHISTDRYQAELPYELLYACAEDSKVFLLYIGMEEVRFVPKRAINEEACETLRTLLRQKMGERYVALKG